MEGSNNMHASCLWFLVTKGIPSFTFLMAGNPPACEWMHIGVVSHQAQSQVVDFSWPTMLRCMHLGGSHHRSSQVLDLLCWERPGTSTSQDCDNRRHAKQQWISQFHDAFMWNPVLRIFMASIPRCMHLGISYCNTFQALDLPTWLGNAKQDVCTLRFLTTMYWQKGGVRILRRERERHSGTRICRAINELLYQFSLGLNCT